MPQTGTIEIAFDFSGMERSFKRFSKRQVPFVIASALTETVVDTQFKLRGDLPKMFTIRNNWTAKGIRTKAAHKGRLVAVVGSVDRYMQQQTTGETKKSTSKALGVPVKARFRPTTKLTQGKWPGKMFDKRKGFIAKTKSGTSALFVPVKPRKRKSSNQAKRRRKGGRKRIRRLKLMYYLKDSVRVKPRWPLEQTLRRVAAKEWVGNLAIGWRRALATARR
jgi:hypothetical protein